MGNLDSYGTVLHLPHSVSLWVPTQVVRPDRSVGDAVYTPLILPDGTPARDVACYLEPMHPHETLTAFGRMDRRGCHVWLTLGYALPPVNLPASTLLYRAETDECWVLMAPLNAYDAEPTTAHAEGMALFLSVHPESVQ